ncbi:MAG: hypothetical protein JWR74_2683 [Polaromonas sp.]|nr:hypothetical protein [Polaromonas sp.]
MCSASMGKFLSFCRYLGSIAYFLTAPHTTPPRHRVGTPSRWRFSRSGQKRFDQFCQHYRLVMVQHMARVLDHGHAGIRHLREPPVVLAQ